MRFIDLFAGVGGFHLALQDYGECVFASEYDKYARTTYLANHNMHPEELAGDITQVDYNNIPEHDILCAGFPCQPFSLAGKQEGFLHQTQGNLFFNIMQIVSIHRPRVLFLENVKNLISHDKGNTFTVIKNTIEQHGYHIKYKILNSMTHANVPQNRERIFIVCFREEDDANNFIFPEAIPLTTTVEQMLETDVDEKYYMTDMNSPSVQKMIAEIHEEGYIYQYRRYYVRKNNRGVCPTLTANMGTGGHNVPLLLQNSRVRKLTPRECFNLQGYPSDFVLPGSNANLYKQSGNTVCVPLIKRIAHAIMDTIEG